MSKKGHSFNALLDPDHFARLQALAKTLDISMGAVLRNLINSAHAMQVLNIPTCASGQNCFMPHLHPRQATIPNTETPPT